jgi:hypothetical protein
MFSTSLPAAHFESRTFALVLRCVIKYQIVCRKNRWLAADGNLNVSTTNDSMAWNKASMLPKTTEPTCFWPVMVKEHSSPSVPSKNIGRKAVGVTARGGGTDEFGMYYNILCTSKHEGLNIARQARLERKRSCQSTGINRFGPSNMRRFVRS